MKIKMDRLSKKSVHLKWKKRMTQYTWNNLKNFHKVSMVIMATTELVIMVMITDYWIY